MTKETEIADYYERKAAEARLLAEELDEAQATLRGLVWGGAPRSLVRQQEATVRHLQERLDAARYTGD